jgi:hypothetical protein
MMNEPVVMAGFSNTDLIELRYKLDPKDYSNNYIELTLQNKEGLTRQLRFEQVSNLRIDSEFSGGLSGMIIIDISSRQWSNAKIEVVNLEQDPGITFIAQRMEVLLDEFNI